MGVVGSVAIAVTMSPSVSAESATESPLRVLSLDASVSVAATMIETSATA